MSANRFLFVMGAVAGLALSQVAAAQPAPETPRKPVSTQYHDVTVEDPYQWLENDNDPQVNRGRTRRISEPASISTNWRTGRQLKNN
jgi:hypothetical protein